MRDFMLTIFPDDAPEYSVRVKIDAGVVEFTNCFSLPVRKARTEREIARAFGHYVMGKEVPFNGEYVVKPIC